MIQLDNNYKILASKHQYVRTHHSEDKVLVYERGPLLFVFNWNPSTSFEKYPIYCRDCKRATVILSSDDHNVGGHSRVAHQTYEVQQDSY